MVQKIIILGIWGISAQNSKINIILTLSMNLELSAAH